MAPKKGKEKKSKKGKKGGHIAAALISTTSFTAVPRSPPPPPDPDVDIGLSSGILGSSMLTRIPDPLDGEQTEETDTSLYDYTNAKGTLPFAGTMGSRGRAPTPPHGFGDDDTEDDDGNLYDEARDYRSFSPDPLYAQPSKLRSKKLLPPLSSPSPLGDTDGSYYESGPHGHDPDDSRASRGSMRSTGSRRSRSGRQTPMEASIEETIEAQIIETTSLRSAPPDSSLRRSRPGSRTPSQRSMSMTTTPKIETLRQQNAEIISKQTVLETQVKQQQELQKNLMSKLHEHGLLASQNPDHASTLEMGSLLQETQNRRNRKSIVFKEQEGEFLGGDGQSPSLRESTPVPDGYRGSDESDSTAQIAKNSARKEIRKANKRVASPVQLLNIRGTERHAPVLSGQRVPEDDKVTPEHMPVTLREHVGVRRAASNEEGAFRDKTRKRETYMLNQRVVQPKTRAQSTRPDKQQGNSGGRTKTVVINDIATCIDPPSPIEPEPGYDNQGFNNGITDQTIRKQDELVYSFQQRTTVLQEENTELRELNEQLQAEISSVRKMASYMDDDDMGGTQTTMLKKQLQDCKDECDTLKSAVQRCNGELGRYQAKYRPVSGSERDELPGLPVRGPRPSWLVNTKYLAPMFVAYDDRLREKDEAIKQYENEIQHFRAGIEEIIKENERLHLRIEQTDISGPLSMSEWKQLQEQCKLVLEENQLLMEQINVQQNKAKDMHSAHIQEVSKLSKRVITAEAERNDIEVQLEAFKHKYSEMKRECDAAVIDNRSRMGMGDHLEAIAQLKRALEEGRSKHHEEIHNLTNRFQTTNSEKKGVAIEMEDLKSQHKHLQADLKTLHKINRKQVKKIQALQNLVEMTQASELTKEHYLTTVLKVAEKTAHERDSLSVAMEEKERQKRTAMNKLMADKVAVGKMEERIKLYKLKATEKVEKAVLRLKEQDHDFRSQQQEYEREIRHLRLLVKEKDEMLDSITGDKRRVEDDLETMWQVASADNRRMKDTMKRSLRKLKDHSNLGPMIDIEGPEPGLLVTCDSDKEN